MSVSQSVFSGTPRVVSGVIGVFFFMGCYIINPEVKTRALQENFVLKMSYFIFTD